MSAALSDGGGSWGLTCRFRVKIDQQELGGWESCKGLQVDFGLKEIREGGTNDHSYWLPDQVKYDKITLTRAMTKSASRSVQDWLAQNAGKSLGSTASITLLDARGEDVQTWTLQNVLPLSWQGPSLTAQDSKVAVETLVLVHEGFAEFEPRTGLNGGGPRVKAKLQNEQTTETVAFDYSPATMTLSRGTNIRHDPTNAGKGSTQSIWGGSGPRMLQGKAILTDESGDVRKRAELLLLKWMDPGGGSGSAGGGAPAKGKAGGGGSRPNATAKPQVLTFTWGGWDPIRCTLKRVSINYVRFTSSGIPTRAEVDFTVSEELDDSGKKKQNPTSGGVPGRHAHVLTDSENLHLIATRNYGHPGAWRAIADVNGIDDPFRVRPGRTVYLPNANELIGG
jgi:phage tail-like protein